jgi:beta-galactosidase
MLQCFAILSCSPAKESTRTVEKFTRDWKFNLGDSPGFKNADFDDTGWRSLNLPHDWSIEGAFDEKNPSTFSGGALPGGVGWYRKTFTLPADRKDRLVFIDFDGVYWNSEVWINEEYLGKRPSGYSSFRYDLTPHLRFGPDKNVVAVRVDNSKQPNSRWYSGSGIYRNVWLVTTDKVHVDHWGTFVTTPEVSEKSARVSIKTKVSNASGAAEEVQLTTSVYDGQGRVVVSATAKQPVPKNGTYEFAQELQVANPALWSVKSPQLYKAVSEVVVGGKKLDIYETPFGIRFFKFDPEKGFFLNGKPQKILGVCNHHDLGCLGAAVNTRALERQLEILRGMGVNAIRTSHNTPAPELLDLCDRMGFLVMDEAFDVWKNKKVDYDYHQFFDEWHRRDLEDLVLRDRNHPSVIIWSIGNEIMEQWDSTGIPMTRDLVGIVKALDTSRPVTAGLNPPSNEGNSFVKSGALDLIGYNYDHRNYEAFPKNFPAKIFIGTESCSSLASRGHYDMPSDSIRRWPVRWDLPFKEGNPGNTVSAYDNVSAPWGSTQRETWRLIKKFDYLSGMFIWTGFDYIGEPTPYGWPSRSSYFGIVDLAGFPKDSYYLYQSEWTDQPTLHIFPHWNWPNGKAVDVWAYTNCEEVELFLNGKSLGTKRKTPDDLHLVWRVTYEPGTLKAIGRTGGKEVMTKEIHTAGAPAKVVLQADRTGIHADGSDLSFVTVRIEDANGNLIPDATNLVRFEVTGEGFIAGVDNGSQTSLESFKANQRKAFNGLCLAVLQSNGKAGKIVLKAASDGLEGSIVEVMAK